MAGMEGGVGGPKLDWRTYRWVMLGLVAVCVAGVVFGVRMGWW